MAKTLNSFSLRKHNLDLVSTTVLEKVHKITLLLLVMVGHRADQE
jgi:hypothetical protein